MAKYKYSIKVGGKKVGTNSESKVADYLLGINKKQRVEINKFKRLSKK
jgi:hypothetical protein